MMNEFARNIDHLEVTVDPYAPLYSEPIAFVDQCALLNEPIKQLQIAWGNKDTFPRVLEILMRMNWYAQRLPLQPKGSFARPSGFMECSIKRAIHTLQILTTLSFYPRLPTIRKYQEIERVKLTALVAALLSSVGEPAVNFEVVSYDNNHQLIRRKNEYERLDKFLDEDVEFIHINFQDPPPKEFYSSIAIDLMHEIVPDDLMQEIALAYDRNLRRFLQNFVGRNFIQAEVANHKLFNCLISADVITQDLEFAFSGKRVDRTPLPHLQHEMEIVLAHKFKGDWSMEAGKAKYCKCVTLWKGEIWIRYPLGFEEIAELARQKWPFTEIPLNAQSLFSYCSYLGIIKQPPNSDLEERVFMEYLAPTERAGRGAYREVSCPAVVLNEPILYMEETSAWAQELKQCLPEKVLEANLRKKPDIKNIVADSDKKKADTTLSVRNKRESTLISRPGSGSKIIEMASEMINAHIEKLQKEKEIVHGSPVEIAKKSANESARKAITKKKTLEMQENFKKENLYPFNKEILPNERTIMIKDKDQSTSTEKPLSGFQKFFKSIFTFFRTNSQEAEKQNGLKVETALPDEINNNKIDTPPPSESENLKPLETKALDSKKNCLNSFATSETADIRVPKIVNKESVNGDPVPEAKFSSIHNSIFLKKQAQEEAANKSQKEVRLAENTSSKQTETGSQNSVNEVKLPKEAPLQDPKEAESSTSSRVTLEKVDAVVAPNPANLPQADPKKAKTTKARSTAKSTSKTSTKPATSGQAKTASKAKATSTKSTSTKATANKTTGTKTASKAKKSTNNRKTTGNKAVASQQKDKVAAAANVKQEVQVQG